MIRRRWDRPIFEYEIDRLWLLEASDDLVLDSSVWEVLLLKVCRQRAFQCLKRSEEWGSYEQGCTQGF
jgi:hypothetical protein